MFWHKDKAPKAPAYMNTWYDISLKTLAKKISQTIKDDKTYSNIPFGKSLIDVHSDGENAFISVKTIVDGKQNIREIHAKSPYVSAFLQPSQLKKDWVNSDDEINWTRESLKKICVPMANLIYDNNEKQDTWIFPYFNYFIVVEIDETNKENGKKYISGSASIRDFNGEYGSGGSVSGTVFGDDEKVKSRDRILGLDFSLHQTLLSSKVGETVWHGRDWMTMKADEKAPVGEISLIKQ